MMLNLTNLTEISSNYCFPGPFSIHGISTGIFFATIFCLLTFFTNLYVLLTIILNKKLHVMINLFFISTSITGIIVAVLNIPVETVYAVRGYRWHHGISSCILWYTLDACTCAVNMYSLAIVSFIRYRTIKRPTQRLQRGMLAAALVLIWTLPFTVWSIVNTSLMTVRKYVLINF